MLCYFIFPRLAAALQLGALKFPEANNDVVHKGAADLTRPAMAAMYLSSFTDYLVFLFAFLARNKERSRLFVAL